MSLFRRNQNSDRPPFEVFYIYVLALICGYWISDLTILKIRPSMLPTEAPPSRPAQTSRATETPMAQYQIIKDRNIFNLDGKIPPPIASDGTSTPGVDAPPVASQLPLKLEGTLVHANPHKSVASIGIKSKPENKSYMVDSEIENMAKIVSIERRKVILRNLNNQRLEFIEIPQESSMSFGVKDPVVGSSSEEVQHKGNFDFTMRRADLNKYVSNLGSVLQQARMVPNIVPGSGGRVDGFRFVAIEPGSIFEKLGFKPNDVIKGANGQIVNSPTQAMEMFNALRSEGRVQLTVERNGREENFKYDIPD